MRLISVLSKSVSFVEKFAVMLGWLGATSLFFMCILTVIDVTLRRLPFQFFLLGIVEISQLLNVILCFSVLAIVFFYDHHISVTIVYDRLPRRIKKLFKKVNLLIAATLWGVVTWEMAGQAIWSVQKLEVQFGVAKVPVWPARIIAVIGTALLFASLLITLILEFTKSNTNRNSI